MPQNGAKDLKVNVSRPLTDDEWNHFQELLKKSNFWSMPSEDVKEKGLDGATLLLEGKRRSQHHLVDRWFPENQNFLDACGYLLATNTLEDQVFIATPVIAAGELFLRSQNALFCISEK